MRRTLIFLLFITCGLFAQTDSTFNFTLPELKIYQVEKKKNVIYKFEFERNNFLLSDSLLTADPKKYTYSVPLANIKKVSVRDGTYVWKTARVMGLVGAGLFLAFGIGLAADHGSSSEGWKIPPEGIILVTLAGGVVFCIVGALIGLTIPYFENYDLKEKDLTKKKEMIRKIFGEYNLNKK